MAISTQEITEFLLSQQMHLFSGLDETQLTRIAKRLQEFKRANGQTLFSQGDDADNFYILKQGRIRVWRMEYQEEIELAVLEPGDYFGEEELLSYQPRIASITALDDSSLLYLENADFEWMLLNFPEIKPNLEAIARSHQRARKSNFEWLGEGEVIHLISQRHVAHLLFNLLRPSALFLPGAFTLYLIIIAPTLATQLLASIISGLFLAAAVLWTLWYILDWRNDFFIVTNQRVVWLEQVILQSASRHEAPMTAIQSVNTRTSLLGRALDYGDVIVRTFTGSMVMMNVRNPLRLKGHVEELILRVRHKSQESKLENIRFSIRKSLGYDVEEEQPETEQPLPPVPQDKRKGFGLFKTREVDGDTYTYHKHWFTLLRNTRVTLLAVFTIFILMSWLLVRNYATGAYPPPSTLFLLGGFALTAPVLILIYQYMDWRNDQYTVSKDAIIDREKKPFSTEITKSAPLKNVLSLNHEKRGILGVLLNFGEVNINVGDATLTFRNVPNPAQIQQDIFYRMEKLKQHEEADREAADQQRLTDWIRTYHEITDESQDSVQT